MNTHNWSNDFKDLLGSMSISLYPTSLFTKVIDAYGVTKKSFNSTFRTRYSDITVIKKNADYYAKKAPFMIVDDKSQAICSFVQSVDDIIDKNSNNLICMNTAIAISLPAQYTPSELDDYLRIAAKLRDGDSKEQAIYTANEKYFNRIDLILHHLQDVDLSSIANEYAKSLKSHIRVNTFVR